MRTALALCFVAVTAASGAAQTKGTHRGLLVPGSNLGSFRSYALQLDANGVPTTLLTSVGGPFGIWSNLFGASMDSTNQLVLLPGAPAPQFKLGFFEYDPVALAVVGTVYVTSPTPSTLTNLSNLTIDSDGDIITIDNQSRPQALVKFDRFTGTLSRTNLSATHAASGGHAGCEYDAFTGRIRHAGTGSNATAPTRLYETTYDFSSTVPITTSTVMTRGWGGTTMENGDWIGGTCCAQSYYEVKAGSGAYTVGTAFPGTIAADVTHEKYAAPGRGVWFVNSSPRAVGYIDLDANAVTTIHTGTGTTMPSDGLEVLPLFDNDLATRRIGKSQWNLTINPGNGAFAGRGFVIACSIAAARPGVALPDGRQIFIGVDTLTQWTAAGLAGPFLSGNIGFLPATGRATATIDLSLLASQAASLNGTALHFCAVVLDRQASNGVGWVCDPHCFVIEILP